MAPQNSSESIDFSSSAVVGHFIASKTRVLQIQDYVFECHNRFLIRLEWTRELNVQVARVPRIIHKADAAPLHWNLEALTPNSLLVLGHGPPELEITGANR